MDDTSLADVQGVIRRYQQLVASAQADLLTLRGSLPRRLLLAGWGAALRLVWPGIAQTGLLAQGLEMMERGRVGREQ